VVSELIATWQNLAEFGRLPKKRQIAANCLGNGNIAGNKLQHYYITPPLPKKAYP